MDNDSRAPSTEPLSVRNYDLILDVIVRVDALTSRLEAVESAPMTQDEARIRNIYLRLAGLDARVGALEARPQDNISMAIESLRAERDRIVATPEGEAAVPRTAPEQTGRIQEQCDAGWLTGGQRTQTLEGGCGHCGKSYHKPPVKP